MSSAPFVRFAALSLVDLFSTMDRLLGRPEYGEGGSRSLGLREVAIRPAGRAALVRCVLRRVMMAA